MRGRRAGRIPVEREGSVAVLERTHGQLFNERAGVHRVATSVGMEAGCTPVGSGHGPPER